MLEGGDGQRARQITFIPLDNEWEVAKVFPHFSHVPLEREQALEVLVELLGRGVGDEDDAIHPLQHGDARALIEHLAGDGIELEADVETMNQAELDGEEIEGQRA